GGSRAAAPGEHGGARAHAPLARAAFACEGRLGLDHPVEHQLEVFVAGLADPAAVLGHVALARGARELARAEGDPAELAVVVLGAWTRRPICRVPQQLLAQPILTLKPPIVLGDHQALLHPRTAIPSLTVPAPAPVTPAVGRPARSPRCISARWCTGWARAWPARMASVRVTTLATPGVGDFCPGTFALRAGAMSVLACVGRWRRSARCSCARATSPQKGSRKRWIGRCSMAAAWGPI